ncbi:hypothetical protein [Methylobacterium fujisawaense]
MKETEVSRANHYALANETGVVEINPHQVRYIQGGPDADTTRIHFGPGDSIVVAMPFERVSADFRHVLGTRMKQWG